MRLSGNVTSSKYGKPFIFTRQWFQFLVCECFSWYTSSEITIIRSGRYRHSISLGRSFSVRLLPFIARFAILNRISGSDSPLMSTLHHLLDTHKLTHCGRVTYICVGKPTIIGWRAPSHYLNQCWNIVNCTHRNNFQWHFKRNSDIFSQENALEYVVCEMAAILSRPQCVKMKGKCICSTARRILIRSGWTSFCDSKDAWYFGICLVYFITITNLRQIALVSITGALAW